MVRVMLRVRTLTLTLTRSPLELAAQLGHVEIVALFEQVSSCGSRTFFYRCHPKQALAGVGQPWGRAGV